MKKAEDVYAPRVRNIPAARGALWAPTLFWNVPGPRPDFTKLQPDPGAAINVYANHGRWVVSCPDCNGAQFACRTDPRFICTDCGNVAVGGRWRRLAWPTNWTKIEALLEIRPPMNQNWWPGESEDDLQEQNLLRGLGSGIPNPPTPVTTKPPFPRRNDAPVNQAKENDEAKAVT